MKRITLSNHNLAAAPLIFISLLLGAAICYAQSSPPAFKSDNPTWNGNGSTQTAGDAGATQAAGSVGQDAATYI
jgi:hypothetical protein